MEALFKTTESLQEKILSLINPEFISQFVLYRSDALNTEKEEAVTKTLEEVPVLFENWENELRNLLGSSISQTDKIIAFDKLELSAQTFESKLNEPLLEAAIKNTKFQEAILTTYKEECNQFKKMISKLLVDFRSRLTKYKDSLIINQAELTSNGDSPSNDKSTLTTQIGWNNATINFETFFNKLIGDGMISLPNGTFDKLKIFSILNQIFKVVEPDLKVNNKIYNQAKIPKVEQVIDSKLWWRGNLESFAKTFGCLIADKGNSTMFLNISGKKEATPIGRNLYNAFHIAATVTEDSLCSRVRNYKSS